MAIVVTVFMLLAISFGLMIPLALPAAAVVLFAKACGGLETWLRAARLRDAMRKKGYHWVTADMARMMARRARPDLIRRIPERDELAALPGYIEGDSVHLTNCAKLLQAYARASDGRAARAVRESDSSSAGASR